MALLVYLMLTLSCWFTPTIKCTQISADVFSEHVVSFLDNTALSAVQRAQKQWHSATKHAMCQRAYQELQNIPHQVVQFNYSRSCGLFSSAAPHTDMQEIQHYMQLFTIDKSMSFDVLLRMVFLYRPCKVHMFEAKHTFGSRATAIREWILTTPANDCDNTDRELQHRFHAILSNNTLCDNLMSLWHRVDHVLDGILSRSESTRSARTVYDIKQRWKDMLFAIKKDMLRILRMDTNRNYGVEFFFNEVWIALVYDFQMLRLYVNRHNEANLVPHSVVLLFMKLRRFESALTRLYDSVKREVGYHVDSDARQMQIDKDVRKMQTEMLDEERQDRIEAILEYIGPRDKLPGLQNTMYLDAVTEYVECTHDFDILDRDDDYRNALNMVKKILMTSLYHPPEAITLSNP